MWYVTSTPIAAENGEIAETYGLRCGATVINDISLCRQEIEEFAELLNRCGASETHAYDLVEDFLGR